LNKLWNIISSLILISLFGTIFLVLFWTLYPYNPIVFKTEPHEVLTPEVVVGGHIRYVLDYCKYMDLGSEVTITFVDGFIYNTTPIPSNIESGCHSVVQSIYVPRALPTGVYSINTLYRYKVNPIRTIDVKTESGKFEVVKSL